MTTKSSASGTSRVAGAQGQTHTGGQNMAKSNKSEVSKVDPAGTATGTAAPAEKVKKEKKKRIAYPIPAGPDGKPGTLTEIPADYDPKVHKPLKEKNFSNVPVFLEYQAANIERKANKLLALAKQKRDEAETERKFPGGSEKAKLAKKRAKLMAQLAKLDEDLAAEGVA